MKERLKSGVIVVGAVSAGAVIWWAATGDIFQPDHVKFRTTVSDALLDPQSAQFRNEKLTAGGLYCGEVNSKNRMGGYAGFNRFIVNTKDGAGVIESEGKIGEGIFGTELLIAELGHRRNLPAEIASLSGPTLDDAVTNLAFDGVWRATCQ